MIVLTPKQKQDLASDLADVLVGAIQLGTLLGVHPETLRFWADGIKTAHIIHTENEPPKPTGRAVH
jgi:hypothetical protein